MWHYSGRLSESRLFFCAGKPPAWGWRPRRDDRTPSVRQRLRDSTHKPGQTAPHELD